MHEEFAAVSRSTYAGTRATKQPVGTGADRSRLFSVGTSVADGLLPSDSDGDEKLHSSVRLVRLLSVGLLVLGCSRAPVVEFEPLAGILELPQLHQDEMASEMTRLFGTSTNPRQRIVDPDAEEPEEGEAPVLIDAADPAHLKYGGEVYNARCAGCHGITGDGAGPAGSHLRPRPRDYRRGIFKFTSTPYGQKPARHDLVRTIRRGAKGTSMPAFPWMSDGDLAAVVDYVIFLSQRGEVERDVTLMAGEYEETENLEFYEFSDAIEAARDSWIEAEDAVVLPVTAEPKYTEETVAAGRTLFLSKGCANCHGTDGKGQVEWINPEFLAEQAALPEDQREKINYDVWGEPGPAADLTARMLHGGRRPIDIYRRIWTGINGTPMPSFSGLFAEEPDGAWHLVHYVRHIIEGGDPTAGIEALPEDEQNPATEGEVIEDTVEASSEEADSDASDQSEVDSAPADDVIDGEEVEDAEEVEDTEEADEDGDSEGADIETEIESSVETVEPVPAS